METDYISREAAISEILSEPTDAHYPSWYAEKLKQIPTADVRPVMRGEWLSYSDPRFPDLTCYCSECSQTNERLSNFCHNCGCAMEGK